MEHEYLHSVDGGCVVAMKGKGCVAIASDRRFGLGSVTVDVGFEKMFKINSRMFLGLAGLQTDVLTVYERMVNKKTDYEEQEECEITPDTFCTLLSHLLYQHRFGPFFVEPVIAALHPTTFEPFICSMDLFGYANETNDYVYAGKSSEQLLSGICKALWKPDLEPTKLFEVIAQCTLHAVDRDATSGWGATVHVIEKHKITTKMLRTRMD